MQFLRLECSGLEVTDGESGEYYELTLSDARRYWLRWINQEVNSIETVCCTSARAGVILCLCWWSSEGDNGWRVRVFRGAEEHN